jgi:sarcosine oxidase, subunit beta
VVHARSPRYSAFGLFWHGLRRRPWGRVLDRPALRDRYDVVIVGGGVHGLATAYYLAANHGITRIAVIEQSYIGSGSTGRNTAIVRSNYLTAEGVAFYQRSLVLYDRLAADLNFNVMFEARGHLTLGHDEGSVRTLRWRAEVNRTLGIDSQLLSPEDCRALVPLLNIEPAAVHPVLAGLWHPPGGILRHDAVVWAYARAATALGVDIHQETRVDGVELTAGRVAAVTTSRGRISTPVVVNCTAGWATTVAALVGVELPITTVPLQAAVSEPVRPFVKPVLASSNLHVYIYQTTRGEVVLGGAVDPFPSYSTRGSLEFLEQIAAHVLELVPALTHLRILRHWSGICDMTPDAAPIIGPSPIDGFVLDVGWGTYGMKAGPAAGESVAAFIATGKVPPLVAPFRLGRFEAGRLVNEKGAAAVGY